jgi:hypothetical protein
MLDSADQLRTTTLSAFGASHFWLTKRSDGRSKNWMMAWYDWSSRTVRLVSSRTESRPKAEAALREFAEQNEHLVLARRASRKKGEQHVYFFGTPDAIKIGVALDVARRLKGIQAHHYHPLQVLATCPGGVRLEREYHARFAAYRLRGEWFERCPAILAEIERLSADAA